LGYEEHGIVLIAMQLFSKISILMDSAKQFFYKIALRPFKVIQGHWFWYQSKARMRLPISPS